MAVNKSYFTSRDYIKQESWLEMWQYCGKKQTQKMKIIGDDNQGRSQICSKCYKEMNQKSVRRSVEQRLRSRPKKTFMIVPS